MPAVIDLAKGGDHAELEQPPADSPSTQSTRSSDSNDSDADYDPDETESDGESDPDTCTPTKRRRAPKPRPTGKKGKAKQAHPKGTAKQAHKGKVGPKRPAGGTKPRRKRTRDERSESDCESTAPSDATQPSVASFSSSYSSSGPSSISSSSIYSSSGPSSIPFSPSSLAFSTSSSSGCFSPSALTHSSMADTDDHDIDMEIADGCTPGPEDPRGPTLEIPADAEATFRQQLRAVFTNADCDKRTIHPSVVAIRDRLTAVRVIDLLLVLAALHHLTQCTDMGFGLFAGRA